MVRNLPDFEKEVIELEVSKMLKKSSKSPKKNASAQPVSSGADYKRSDEIHFKSTGLTRNSERNERT